MRRPTQTLSAFRDAIYAYQAVERHRESLPCIVHVACFCSPSCCAVNINLSDIVRDVLLSEFTDE